MKKSITAFILSFSLMSGLISLVDARDNDQQSEPQSTYNQNLPTDELTISGQWFLSYQAGERRGNEFNQFNLKRGYINIRSKFSDKISVRMTPDISVDREGDGEGDIEMRLKYCYLKYKLPELFFLTSPYIEFGLVHRPWIDYEQEINRYRVQGTMFLERIGIVNSGDYGVIYISNLGGELEDFEHTSHTGKWGSIAFGIYNGGGYHALEENLNKTIESRLTLRPLPQIFPYVQISYYGAYGKGNTDEAPDWVLNNGFLSLEHRNFIFTAMYSNGRGNYTGTLVNAQDEAIKYNAYSLFTEIKFLDRKFSLIGRYDYNDPEPDAPDQRSQRYIAGIAYHFSDVGKILLDYDMINYHQIDKPDEKVFEFAIELRY